MIRILRLERAAAVNLLVDVGNSRVKWACDGPRWSVAAADTRGFEPSTAWDSLTTEPLAVIVANVAGDDVQERIARWCRSAWSVEAVFIASRAHELGVVNEYRDAGQLGCDRWAALLGARALTSNAAAVVDCGTAVTADALAAHGRFLGGVIMPGVDLMRESLRVRAHRIEEDRAACVSPLGRSTGECVLAGATYAVVGGLERVLAEFQAALGTGMEVFMTGGSAPDLAPLMGRPVDVRPDLVLQGLAHIARTRV